MNHSLQSVEHSVDGGVLARCECGKTQLLQSFSPSDWTCPRAEGALEIKGASGLYLTDDTVAPPPVIHERPEVLVRALGLAITKFRVDIARAEAEVESMRERGARVETLDAEVVQHRQGIVQLSEALMARDKDANAMQGLLRALAPGRKGPLADAIEQVVVGGRDMPPNEVQRIVATLCAVLENHPSIAIAMTPEPGSYYDRWVTCGRTIDVREKNGEQYPEMAQAYSPAEIEIGKSYVARPMLGRAGKFGPATSAVATSIRRDNRSKTLTVILKEPA